MLRVVYNIAYELSKMVNSIFLNLLWPVWELILNCIIKAITAVKALTLNNVVIALTLDDIFTRSQWSFSFGSCWSRFSSTSSCLSVASFLAIVRPYWDWSYTLALTLTLTLALALALSLALRRSF